MESLENIRFYVFAGGLALFTVMESLRPQRAWSASRPRRWGLHGGISLTNAILVRAGAAAPFWLWAAYVAKKEWGLLPWLGITGPLEIGLGIVLLDLLNYFWHRINHEWGFLWRFHQTHHSDDCLDTSTSLRFHPGELVLSWIAKGVWLLIVGPSVYAFFVFECLISFAAQFHHANWRLGWLDEKVRWVTPWPLFHAAHQTKTVRSRNGNYSTILSVWDRLFGTYCTPETENLEDLGLPGPQRPLSAVDFLLRPFKKVRPSFS